MNNIKCRGIEDINLAYEISALHLESSKRNQRQNIQYRRSILTSQRIIIYLLSLDMALQQRYLIHFTSLYFPESKSDLFESCELRSSVYLIVKYLKTLNDLVYGSLLRQYTSHKYLSELTLHFRMTL